jgi:hypothetical protein
MEDAYAKSFAEVTSASVLRTPPHHACPFNPFVPPPGLFSRIWSLRLSQVLEAFGVDRTKGLSDSQVFI